MKKQLSFLFIALAFFSCRKVNDTCIVAHYPNAPEQLWFTSASGSGEESHGHFLLSCSDGGYLQVGETGFIPNSAKLLVVKTDHSGTLEWKKEFSGGTGHNLGNAAFETNEAYFICGSLNENSTLIKLNKLDGAVLFEQTHDNGGSDAYEHLIVDQNGIIAVGYTNAEDPSNTFFTEGKAYLAFLDLDGNKIGSIDLQNEMAHAYRIKALQNDYVVSGLSEGALDYALIRISSSGTILWNNSYGGNNSDHCFGMDISNDEYIYLTGHTLSGTENWDTYTLKVDGTGTLIWESKIGNPRGFDPKYIHDEAWGIQATPDGGCLVVAGTGDEYNNYKRRCGNNGDNSNIWHVYLIKYDSSGTLEWQKTLGDPNGGSWAGEDIALSSDGGAVVAVDNGSFGFLKVSSF